MASFDGSRLVKGGFLSVVTLLVACSAKANRSDATNDGAGDAGAGDAAAPLPVDAGAGDAAAPLPFDAGGDAPIEAVRVIRGDPNRQQWWDLTIRGAELAQYEGKMVTVRIGDPNRPPERLGSAQALVGAGALELFFPQVWEASLYKHKRVFIDADDDGVCNAAVDPVFDDARATQDPVLTVRATPSSATDLLHSLAPDADCALFNAPWPTQ